MPQTLLLWQHGTMLLLCCRRRSERQTEVMVTLQGRPGRNCCATTHTGALVQTDAMLHAQWNAEELQNLTSTAGLFWMLTSTLQRTLH